MAITYENTVTQIQSNKTIVILIDIYQNIFFLIDDLMLKKKNNSYFTQLKKNTK